METVNLPRDSSLLSAANKLPIEQRELILLLARRRIKIRQIYFCTILFTLVRSGNHPVRECSLVDSLRKNIFKNRC